MKNTYTKGLSYLAKMRPEDIWMAAVDGKLYKTENGPIEFDQREQGSVKGIIEGLSRAIITIGSPLTFETVEQVHATCIHGVVTQGEAVPGVRTESVAFNIKRGWFSKEGLMEIASDETSHEKICVGRNAALPPDQYQKLNKKLKSQVRTQRINNNGYDYVIPLHLAVELKKNKAIDEFCGRFDPDDDQIRLKKSSNMEEILEEEEKSECALFYIAPTGPRLKERCNRIIKKYHEEVAKANDQNDILIAVATLTKELCKTHPFIDGNNRTFVNCILNTELMKHGLPFVMLYEPNLFEFHTVPQIVEVLKDAMVLTTTLTEKQDETLRVYEFRSEEILASEKDKYTAMGKNFLQTLTITVFTLGCKALKAGDFEQAADNFELTCDLKIRLGEESDKHMVRFLSMLVDSVKKISDHVSLRQHCTTANSIFDKMNLPNMHEQINAAKKTIEQIEKMILFPEAVAGSTLDQSAP